MTRAFVLPLIALAAAYAVPAAAQEAQAGQGPEEKYNQVIVYGDDACPASTDGSITVCARLDEGERFRIPSLLRDSQAPENTAWTERVRQFETVGAFGTNSCSPTGPGGVTGCTQKLIDAAFEERRTNSDVRFSELIDEERQKRLATIDSEAAATQARVEQLEKEYMERLEREGGIEDTAASSTVDAEPLPNPAN
jgi:hypothetical protein